MSLKSSVFSSAVLLGSISLAGCAGHHSGEQALQQACPLPSEALSLEWLASALPDLGEAERVELLTLGLQETG